jgi:C1A family cysteine protease
MAISLSEVSSAITRADANWEAGETDVSRFVNLPVEDGNLFGLSITDEQAIALLAEADLLQAQTFRVAAPPPSSIDWRNYNGRNYVTPIKNQRTCGSCVAFATCASLESRVAIQREKADPQLDLSEAHLFFCGCGRCCRTGWSFVPALNWAKKGIGLEALFPYTPGDQPCPNPQPAASVEVPSWTAVTSMVARKQAIAADGPVIAGLNVYEDFYFYKSGIYRQTTGIFRGRHAVCVVGYEDRKDGTGYWILKNSWGPGWGENGFMRIEYGDAKCGMDSTFPYYDAVAYALPGLVV